MATHQAPPSLGFSKQEHWSGLPFPSPMHERDDVMESLKLSDYFKIIKPTYCYIKITPHKSIRNYNTCSIAKAVSTTYKSLDRRLHREQKKLIVESNFKVSYIIDIYGTDVNFYFVVPEFYRLQ